MNLKLLINICTLRSSIPADNNSFFSKHEYAKPSLAESFVESLDLDEGVGDDVGLPCKMRFF